MYILIECRMLNMYLVQYCQNAVFVCVCSNVQCLCDMMCSMCNKKNMEDEVHLKKSDKYIVLYIKTTEERKVCYDSRFCKFCRVFGYKWTILLKS